MSVYERFLEEVKGFGIPSPFFIKNNILYRVDEKNDKEDYVIRQVPYVTKCFDDIEKNNVQYQLKWYYEGKVYEEIVPATGLATRREVVSLANKGLASSDRNARNLIEYFDLFLNENKLNRSLVVSHLGYVGKQLIHPLIETKFRVVAPGDGEEERLGAFKCNGTVEDWIDSIFKPFRINIKSSFAITSSFASVLLAEYNIPPIVVDISGSSSKGKTSVQKVCASVWGIPKPYIGTMSTTKVGVERLAGFLNAFPLILDDTNSSDKPQDLQHMIYLFSSGKGKIRGDKEGSRITSSWQSIFITTGENNILEYTNAQGTAARVIPLTNFSTDNIASKYFNDFDENVEVICGSVGLEFLKRWELNKHRFEGRFKELEALYREAVSKNRIMRRIAKPFSFIVFVAEVLNDLFKEENLAIPVDDFAGLFLSICNENNHVDRAKNVLVEILEELEANRSHVYDEFEPSQGIHAIVKTDGLFLTINYLKRKLQVDEKQIREAWKNQQYIVLQKNNGKSVDYLTITHKGQSFRVVQVSQKFLEEQGFNFSRNRF